MVSSWNGANQLRLCDCSLTVCVRKVLAAIGNNDRGAFMAGGLLSWYVEVRVHIVVCAARAGGCTVAPEVLLVIEVLQGVACQGVGCMLAQERPWVGAGGIEGWGWDGGSRACARPTKRMV